MYVVTKAKKGLYRDLRKLHMQKAMRSRKEGIARPLSGVAIRPPTVQELKTYAEHCQRLVRDINFIVLGSAADERRLDDRLCRRFHRNPLLRFA